MAYAKLTVEPPTKRVSSRRRVRPKGRAFSARLLGYLTADTLWELGATGGDVVRPVWLAYFATTGETKPFTANVRKGRRVSISGRDSLQIPKSSSHRWASQVVPGGVVTVAYLPEILHLQPAVPFTDDVRFVMAPPRAWIERQANALRTDFGDDAPDAARAALFAAYVDRRTALPLLCDLRFHLALYRAALDQPWATHLERTTNPPRCLGLDESRLDRPLVCSVDGDAFAAFLTEQTRAFHRPSLVPSHDLDVAGVDPFRLALALIDSD